MPELKTKPSHGSIDKFLKEIRDESVREDCFRLKDIMADVTGEKPVMWGKLIIGFGTYHYKYESGREGDWFLTGFSPRKQNLTLYIMSGFEKNSRLMKRLGKYRTGRSCLYVNSLSDVDTSVLKRLIEQSVKDLKSTYC